MLLTSLAFMIAALALTRRQVLVQELPAVEGLARVDVVCLDKTGTLTVGDIVFDRLDVLAGEGAPGDAEVRAALGAIAAGPDPNASAQALAAAFDAPAGWERTGEVPQEVAQARANEVNAANEVRVMNDTSCSWRVCTG